MPLRRAVLIQSISEYLAIIRPPLRQLVGREYLVNELDAIKWIIGEELELIYHLFDKSHHHNHPLYSYLHSGINRFLPVNLSLITAHYIKAPRLYNDNLWITIGLTELDLMIEYRSNVPFLEGFNNVVRQRSRNNKNPYS